MKIQYLFKNMFLFAAVLLILASCNNKQGGTPTPEGKKQ
jgi:hypothetical protein